MSEHDWSASDHISSHRNLHIHAAIDLASTEVSSSRIESLRELRVELVLAFNTAICTTERSS
jgi:hypothetical protein